MMGFPGFGRFLLLFTLMNVSFSNENLQFADMHGRALHMQRKMKNEKFCIHPLISNLYWISGRGNPKFSRLLTYRKRLNFLRLNGGGTGGAGERARKQFLKMNALTHISTRQLSGLPDNGEDEEKEGHWKPMCRICYELDPIDLFVPCKCTGSMGYVHRLHPTAHVQK